jgi:hypothetical protein
MRNVTGFKKGIRNWLPFKSTWVQPRDFLVVSVLIIFLVLCVVYFLSCLSLFCILCPVLCVSLYFVPSVICVSVFCAQCYMCLCILCPVLCVSLYFVPSVMCVSVFCAQCYVCLCILCPVLYVSLYCPLFIAHLLSLRYIFDSQDVQYQFAYIEDCLSSFSFCICKIVCYP